jgi:uncharacterized membrane protein
MNEHGSEHPHDGGAPPNRSATTGTSLGVDANLLGLLAYLFGIVSGVLILVLEKQHAEVRFHAAQSIVVSIALIALSFVSGLLTFVPILGLIVGVVIWIGSVILWIYLLIQGYRLNHVELPLLGGYAVKLAARA